MWGKAATHRAVFLPLSLSETHARIYWWRRPPRNWHGQWLTDGLDGAGDWCVFLQ
jgi:hypothetical protein